jgi:hypothetical protein
LDDRLRRGAAGNGRLLLQLIAAIAILAGSQAARWFAVVVIGLNAIGQM